MNNYEKIRKIIKELKANIGWFRNYVDSEEELRIFNHLGNFFDELNVLIEPLKEGSDNAYWNKDKTEPCEEDQKAEDSFPKWATEQIERLNEKLSHIVDIVFEGIATKKTYKIRNDEPPTKQTSTSESYPKL